MVGVEAMASGCPVLVSKKSGVAELFDNTPAMRVVEGGAAPGRALRRAALARGRSAMRAAALDYSHRELASWGDVLEQDLYALWRAAADAAAQAELPARARGCSKRETSSRCGARRRRARVAARASIA